MSIRTRILGTVAALAIAALATGPAAAGSLTDFAGVLTTSYGNTNDSLPGSKSVNDWLIGGSAAGPLSDLAGLNFQVDASYDHNWRNHYSAEDWNFGGNLFWANADGRFGVNVNYDTVTHFGHTTTGGFFGEWYFDNITAMGKGGWVSSGGSAIGGHGTYYGAALSVYATPDAAFTGGITQGQLISGFGCQTCGRSGLNVTQFQIGGEILAVPEQGLSFYASFDYDRFKESGDREHSNTWRIGARWYMGGGTLQNHHRNGNLNPWLPGAGG